MLKPVILILAMFCASFLARRILNRSLAKKNDELARANRAYEGLWQENLKLKSQNSSLEKTSEETIALYDITKDICKSLDEDTVFAIFKQELSRFMGLGDCLFLKAGVDLTPYKEYTVIPLLIQHVEIGNLLAADIQAKDRDKFHILAQQFLIGIKRAILYRKVQEISLIDSLTGAFSRRYFFEKFQDEFARAKRNQLKLALLMLDIDHFKPINDKFGHLVGDVILKEVAMVIRENIRQIDFSGRYGGEELLVVLAETDKEQARFAAERIRQAVEAKLIRAYDEEVKATVSIGVAAFPDDAREASSIIEKADAA
ncbi:MAG: GGDEF domain-containing protein, partial [Candidatus Omnitrophota bacterium]